MEQELPITHKDLEAFWKDQIEPRLHKMIETLVNERIDIELKKTQRRQITAANTTRRPTLLNFGNENYEHLLLPYLASIIKNSSTCEVILQRVIRELFFNPDQKKNNNVYIPKDAYNAAHIYKDNNWRSYSLDFTLEQIIKRANDVLQHYFIGTDPEIEKQFAHEVGKKKYEMIKEFTDKIDNIEQFPDFFQKLRNETEHTVITHQHIVHPNVNQIPTDNSR